MMLESPKQLRLELARLVNDQADAAEMRTLTEAERRVFEEGRSATPCLSTLGVSSFVGLPTAPLDPRFATVTDVSNSGVSNYNGLTV